MRDTMKIRSSRVGTVLGAVLWLWAATALCAGEPGAADSPAPVRWSLGDVLATALANHPLVGQADAEVRAAGARRGQAASVTLPQASGAASWIVSEAPSAASGDQESTTTATVQGALTQLITDFGRTGASVASAGQLAEAARESALSSRIDVVYGANLTYFNVLRAESVVRVRGETMRQRESLLQQAQAFFEAGVRARIDVVRAEANLYQARADASSAGHELRTARLLLLNRMGVDGPEDFVLEGVPAVIEAAGTLEDWQREADEKHPDLLALRLQLAAARSARDAAARGDYPVISASGRLGWAGDDLPSDRNWALGAHLTLPIFNGHLTREQTAEAEANVAAAEFALADRRRQIRLLVEQADQAMREALEREAAREKEREAFAENLRLATGRYEAGAGDIIEMIDAQVQMAAADTAHVQARFDRATALATLYRALGRLPLESR